MSTQQVFTGTPEDIGADVFIQVCMPILRKASNQYESSTLMRIYSGFFSAMYGSMVADFGRELAGTGIEVMANAASKFTPEGGMTQ